MISFKKKYNSRFCSLGLAVATALGFAACSDWTDHYDADTAVLDSQQATLWENISKDGSLSQFASLLKKTGYDEVLSNTQTYTVWAPADGSFDYDAVNALSDSRLQHEFVENHIARNNYPASGAFNQRIYTLNEKLMFFGGNGDYAIQDVHVDKPNEASRNGVMHKLNGKIPFMANIYESLNNNDYALDSIAELFHSYDVKKLNEQKSVVGPTVNGEITYLDSVFDEHNPLFTYFDAYINHEDSSYTMIVPTNEAWTRAKEQLNQYFKYLPSFEFMENTSTGSDKKKVNVKVKDIEYLRDSMVNHLLLSELFYNNNIYDNKKLKSLQTGETLRADSLYSTSFSKVYSEDASRLFANARRIDKSNGAIWVTDSLGVRPWTTWNPEIVVEAENSQMLASTVNVSDMPQRVYVAPGTQNPEVGGRLSMNSYAEAQPISQSTNPGVVYYLPNVRSTTYSVYLVTVPANVVSSNYEKKPNRFRVTMGYANEKGTNEDNDSKWTVESTFTSDSANVDTLYLGDFTFPMAYAGTGEYYPYMRINSYVLSRERNQYDRTLRLDCIILRPKELDDYLKANPGYKYDTGIY